MDYDDEEEKGLSVFEFLKDDRKKIWIFGLRDLVQRWLLDEMELENIVEILI
jgi:hypothetical protein